VSASNPAVTELYRYFPQSLQANAGIEAQLNHNDLLPNPLQIINNFIV
jgi:hypothetical protein